VGDLLLASLDEYDGSKTKLRHVVLGNPDMQHSEIKHVASRCWVLRVLKTLFAPVEKKCQVGLKYF
jgi:hypothetical protein